MKKHNVLLLVTGFGMGGAEKVVLNLAKHLDRNKFNVYVIGMSERDELLEEYIRENINVTLLRKSNSFKDFLQIIAYLNKFIKTHNINIIHAHMTHPTIVACVLKILNSNISVFFTSHSLNVGSKMREFILFCLKPLRKVDIVFSKSILRFFHKKKYEVIPNGIEVAKYNLKLKKYEIFTFIAVGRLEHVKNHKLLIKAAKELKDKYKFQILIVGDGYLRNELQDLINKYNVKGIVKLLGLRNNIPTLLNQSHCFVMPSLWEGLPVTILEAMASELPIIATPVGSIKDILNDQNAYLCEENEFVDTMKEVLNDYEKAKIKAKKAFEKVRENYSLKKMINLHEELYLKD